jgi:hypothetical protein
MTRDDERSSEELPVVEVDEDEIPRGSIGTGGGLHCPRCDSVLRHEVRTTSGTDAFQCDDCGMIYTADGQ